MPKRTPPVNSGNPFKTTPLMDRVIELLLGGASITDVGRAVRRNRSTIHRMYRQEVFRKVLLQRRKECADVHVVRLHALGDRALDVLARALDNEDRNTAQFIVRQLITMRAIVPADAVMEEDQSMLEEAIEAVTKKYGGDAKETLEYVGRKLHEYMHRLINAKLPPDPNSVTTGEPNGTGAAPSAPDGNIPEKPDQS